VGWRETYLEAVHAGHDLFLFARELDEWRRRATEVEAACTAAREDGASADALRAIALSLATIRARLAATEHGLPDTPSAKALRDLDDPLSYLRVRNERRFLVQRIVGLDVEPERIAYASSAIRAMAGHSLARIAKAQAMAEDDLLLAAVRAHAEELEFELAQGKNE